MKKARSQSGKLEGSAPNHAKSGQGKQVRTERPLPESLVADRLLSVRETAQQMNWCLDTVRRHLRSGQLKGVKTGRNWRVPQSQLDAFCHDGENAYAGQARYVTDGSLINPGTGIAIEDYDLEEDVLKALLRTKPVRQRVLDLTQTALRNMDVDPDAARATLLAVQDLLHEL